jgi:hypothetical protein
MKNNKCIFSLLFIFVFCGFCTFSTPAKAEAQLGLNTFYLSEQTTAATTTTATKTIWVFDILFSPAGVKRLLFGWDVLGLSVSDTSTTTTTFATSDMGPKVLWYFTKSENWSLGLSYHLIANAKYNPGTAETWTGTSLFIELGYLPNITENISAGFKLNYYSGTFPKQTVGTTTSDVSYKRSLIYPSVGLAYHF